MIRNILVMAALMLPLTFWGQNYKNRTIVGEDSAKQILKNTLESSTYHLPSDTLIKDKDLAIDVAEQFLFNRYGKALISGQRPYECYLIDGYWFLRGTLPKSYTGDIFELIMSAKDGRIIKFTQGNK